MKLWNRRQYAKGLIRVPLHTVFGGYQPQHVRGANMSAFIGRYHQWTYVRAPTQQKDRSNGAR